MPTPKLVSSDSCILPHEILLDDLPVRVGRSTDANVCIEDRWVSRDHCVIEWSSESLTVRDLHSRHGTYVNGQSVTQATLKPGDELAVGLSKFVVQLEQEPAALAPALR